MTSGTSARVFDEELFAYAVETAILQGVTPSAEAAPHSSERWLADVIASIERVGEKLTGQRPAALTAQEVVDLAYAVAQLETPRHAEEIELALQKHLASKIVASRITGRLSLEEDDAPDAGRPAAQ